MSAEEQAEAGRSDNVPMLSTLDREGSQAVAQRIRAQYRRCWGNAAVALRHLGGQPFYVEGWVVVERSAPLIVEHGWCEVDGRIIDPTYTPYVSPLEPPFAYFAGMRLEPRHATEAARLRKLPLDWMRDEDVYRSAFEAALRCARVQRGPREARPPTRVVHCRREAFDVYIGRPTPWGNPFRVGVDGDRIQVIRRFREWIIRRPNLLRAVENLRGKALGCFCAPEPCHGDVLADLADLGEVCTQVPR